MIQSAHALNYEGVFIYMQGQHVEAMRVIHAGAADGERQRLFSLNGPPREIVVAGNRIVCVTPEQQPALGAGYRRSPFPSLYRLSWTNWQTSMNSSLPTRTGWLA